MRPVLLASAIILSACSIHKSELDETLEWMDNTYNPHENISGAYGHGRTAWYAPETVNGARTEFMASGLTETFTYSGCDLTLKTADNPASQKSKEIFNTATFRFNLLDIDPSSIKVSARAHLGDFPCDNYSEEQRAATGLNCDHAEMGFKTRNEAGVIVEEWDAIFVKLTGTDHESRHKSKSSSSYFEFDDVEYAGRFAKAFVHAIQLCGGKAPAF
jgi:hypothetical protein